MCKFKRNICLRKTLHFCSIFEVTKTRKLEDISYVENSTKIYFFGGTDIPTPKNMYFLLFNYLTCKNSLLGPLIFLNNRCCISIFNL